RLTPVWHRARNRWAATSTRSRRRREHRFQCRIGASNMAWRPTQYLLEGELDNTVPGKVTGWMRFVGLKRQVTFDLKGDFHRDIRGAKIRFRREWQRRGFGCSRRNVWIS